MSTVKRMQEQKSAKKKQGRRFGVARDEAVAADWGKVDAEVIRRTIVAVCRAGGALRFGYTSDGGAFALGVYGDGPEPYTEYMRPGSDVAETLTELAQVFYDIYAEADMKQ